MIKYGKFLFLELGFITYEQIQVYQLYNINYYTFFQQTSIKVLTNIKKFQQIYYNPRNAKELQNQKISDINFIHIHNPQYKQTDLKKSIRSPYINNIQKMISPIYNTQPLGVPQVRNQQGSTQQVYPNYQYPNSNNNILIPPARPMHQSSISPRSNSPIQYEYPKAQQPNSNNNMYYSTNPMGSINPTQSTTPQYIQLRPSEAIKSHYQSRQLNHDNSRVRTNPSPNLSPNNYSNYNANRYPNHKSEFVYKQTGLNMERAGNRINQVKNNFLKKISKGNGTATRSTQFGGTNYNYNNANSNADNSFTNKSRVRNINNLNVNQNSIPRVPHPQQIQLYNQPPNMSNENTEEYDHLDLYYQSQIQIQFIGTTTYNQIFDHPAFSNDIVERKNSEGKLQVFVRQDNREIKRKLQSFGVNVFNDKLFLFVADMQPQNIQWQVIKHSVEITHFIQNVRQQISNMTKYTKRKGKTGETILRMHQQLQALRANKQQQIKINFVKKGKHGHQGIIKRPWNESQMLLFANFINQTLKHPFLSKSVLILTFISHCMPIHLWNVKVYQQVKIYDDLNIFTRLFIKEGHLLQFLTVSQDGIIISSKNPMQTRIDSMVPFTNQFRYETYLQDDGDILIKLSSSAQSEVQVNLKNNYIGALNLFIGMRRAFVDSNHDSENRFNSFSIPRKFCWSRLYNDGVGYFSDVCDQLFKAKKQVLMTDWWMTPYISLKRFPTTDQQIQSSSTSTQNICRKFQQYMLANVLRKIAVKGVKIYIILFRQPFNLLSNDSYDCQLFLQSLSPNIKVRRHPITPQLWSHHQKCVIIDQRIGFMGGLDLCYGRFDTPEHHLTNFGNLWDGGDYVNQRIKSYKPGTTKDRQPPVDQSKQPRLPWHDIALQIRGDTVIDMTRHFLQYWYFVDAERVKDPYSHFRNLERRLDRALNFNDPEAMEDDLQQLKGFHCNLTNCKTSTKMFFTGTEKRLRQLVLQVRQGRMKGTQQIQLCRSTSTWSNGARQCQESIHNAYQALIQQSEHLIYIQNQFFMGDQNQIVKKLAKRIQRAYLRKQNFKIVVVMPLLPGFQGSVADMKNVPLRVQVQNQFQSINRGKQSIHGLLSQHKDLNLDDFIFFFGLRGHAIINNKPVTEIVYVHSKLMIVDDKRAIIGSANINDRSMLGNRDSELAVVIQEDNGEIRDPLPRRKQIFQLRYRIFNQHFGLSQQQTANSNDPTVWSMMINNAKQNTLIYRHLFGCYPDDTITVSKEVQQRQNQARPEEYHKYASKIIAHAVEFPLHFLEDQDLSIRFVTKQRLLGEEAFL